MDKHGLNFTQAANHPGQAQGRMECEAVPRTGVLITSSCLACCPSMALSSALRLIGSELKRLWAEQKQLRMIEGSSKSLSLLQCSGSHQETRHICHLVCEQHLSHVSYAAVRT